jgi:hypothetical protein
VSFFRPNLVFTVRDKKYGVDEAGRPEPMASLVDYIHVGAHVGLDIPAVQNHCTKVDEAVDSSAVPSFS